MVLVCAAAAGCLPRAGGPLVALRPPPTQDPAAARQPKSPLPPAQVPGLYVESVLLERPVGDPLLDRDLWADAAAQLPAHTAALLAENGLRVAVLGGTLPPAFQKALESEADTVNPHGLTFANRTDAVIPTAGPTDPCEFSVLPELGAERRKRKLKAASGGLLVRPERCPDGRVKVCCEPQVQHGDRQEFFRPTADATGFTVQGEVPLERYPTLGFEVTLGPNDYLIVGWPAEAAETLGSVLFAVEASGRPRQRVLVIRAGFRGATRSDLPAIPNPRGRGPIAAEAAKW